jgi:MFS family permease
MSTDTAPAATLRGHHVFRLLWAADTVAQHGTFAATAIIPLLAATTLAATPMQMGMLAAAEMAAFLVLGLPAGAWIDRRRRRPILITADLTRAALLLTIPAAALLGVLTLAQLIIAAVAVGAASVFFDVAYQAYLPTAIGEEHLVAGYANLQATQSVGQAAGPGIGGLLTQVTGAANALAVTGLGYLSSAALISRIRTPEPAPPPPAEQARLRTEIGEGLRFITAHPQLRALTIASATAAFFNSAVLAVEVLFFTRDLHLPGVGTGIMLALSGVGSVVGAATTRWWTRHAGTARALWLVPVLTWPAHVLFPLARPGPGVLLAAAGILVFSTGATTYNVLSMSLRQSLAPDRLRGRINASMRVAIWGTMPLGALAAGALAEHLGTRTTLWAAVAGTIAALIPVLSPSLRGQLEAKERS